MKKILLTLTCFVVLCVYSTTLVVYGATSFELPILQWDKTYGGTNDDAAWSVIRTSDGGYAIAGWTASFGAGYEDFWVIKTDENGQMQWNRTYGGSSSEWFGERAYCIIQTSDGGLAIVGETSSFGAGSRDFWLIKTDASGNMEWNETYGGTNQEEPYSLIQTSDGGYAIAGRTLSFGVAGYENMWLVKTDADGIMQWNKAYGGAGIENAYSVIQTDDGGYAIGGETGSWSEERDMLLVKTDLTGNVQWQRTYGLAGSICEFATSLIHTTDGGYALAGFRETVGGDSDFCLVKTDGDGNMQWDKTYGGATREVAWDAIQTGDGGYMLAGGTSWLSSPDLWLVETDDDGNMKWNQTYGGVGSEWAHSAVQIGDRQYVVAGQTTSFGVGSADFWLIKLAPTQQCCVPAMIHIGPNVLNLKSKGQWITCYIELPEGYDVADIDVSTVLLNDTVSAELQPTSIGDYDNDTIPDLMVKFNRTMVSNLILSKGIRHGNVTLTVTGRLYCGTLFTGSDVIRVKMPGDINFDGKVNLNDVLLSAKAMCSHPGSPRWNPAADENEDNVINLIDFFIVCKNYGKTYT